MKLNNILQFLTPKDNVFFPLFEQASLNLIILAQTLHEVVSVPKGEREVIFKKIEELEVIIENIVHKTRLELGKNFITPFDREDIYALIKSLENVSDYMHGAAGLMRVYHIEKITKSIRKLTEINLEACQHIDLAIIELKGMKKLENIADVCKRINKLEKKSDEVYNKSIEDIFENETDVKNIIKYKDVLSSLETATDMCKRVSNVLEQIAVKHS
jgi:uncharacterized protein Yka (UPF0111/DUF47 family)